VRLVVVGGGVIGTALALAAVDRGHNVVQLERDEEPRGASARNFGLIWILGRKSGRELELVLAGRDGWVRIAERTSGVGFRPSGCLLVLRDQGETALAEAVCSLADAERRGFRMLSVDEARSVEPVLNGTLVAALHSPLDAIVEPRRVLPALRRLAQESGQYRFLPGRTVLGVEDGCSVHDHAGDVYRGDCVALCVGDDPTLIPIDLTPGLRRRRLQMIETEAASRPPVSALANGDAMRYYPVLDLPERELLAPPDPLIESHGAQLLVAPRADGRLTLGDTHTDDEAGAFGIDERADDYVLNEARRVLGGLPPVDRRWTGSYLRRTDGGDSFVLQETAPGVVLLTGVGGMGMTAAPAIAAEAAERLNL
jgi:FAD dependent oxidoreductase TIGR03364